MSDTILKLIVDQRSPVPMYEQICQQIRTKIEKKLLQPGTQLPTTQELRTRLQVNSKTAQLAMATLAKEGYVTRRARRGTVVKGIPRRGVVGIYSYMALFAPEGKFEFYRLISSHLGRQLEALGRVHRMYLGSESPDTSNTAGEDLLRHLSSGALSGVMLVNTPHQQFDELVQVGRQMRIPVVALSGNREVDYSVRIDLPGYVRSAAEYLRHQGRRNVGVIFNNSSPSFRDGTLIPRILEESGIRPVPAWIVGQDAAEQGGYDAAGRLPLDKLDGLIVLDDIMATGVDRKLCESGIRVPGNLLVVTLWLQGSRLRLTLPFQRFEVNIAGQVERALQLMQDAIHGQRISEPHLKILSRPYPVRQSRRLNPVVSVLTGSKS
jgi:DNA-binding LacI/PurR family transcriptional regulator